MSSFRLLSLCAIVCTLVCLVIAEEQACFTEEPKEAQISQQETELEPTRPIMKAHRCVIESSSSCILNKIPLVSKMCYLVFIFNTNLLFHLQNDQGQKIFVFGCKVLVSVIN